ncbi:MAG: DUF1465 family protein [Pseudomonadota bacterium]
MDAPETITEASPIDSRVSTFVQSMVFSRNFEEGMGLVEKAADYLDGTGREASRDLSRSGSIAYANISMRVTTLLMQSASWLLVLKAIRENEISIEESRDPKFRLGAREARPLSIDQSDVPAELIELSEQAEGFYDRIRRIDLDLFSTDQEEKKTTGVALQMQSLMDAFGSSAKG